MCVLVVFKGILTSLRVCCVLVVALGRISRFPRLTRPRRFQSVCAEGAPPPACVYLQTACETDPTIISQLMSSVSNGEFSIMIPFVYSQKYATAHNLRVLLCNKGLTQHMVQLYSEVTLAFL